MHEVQIQIKKNPKSHTHTHARTRNICTIHMQHMSSMYSRHWCHKQLLCNRKCNALQLPSSSDQKKNSQVLQKKHYMLLTSVNMLNSQ